LSAGFLVSCGAVDLSGEEQPSDDFRFKRMFQLGGVEEIILYRITGAVYFDVAQCRYFSQGGYLHIHWQGG
jgi:hypothetical protein